MAPQTQPGRPETLSPEQEAKLKEFWKATLTVFGVWQAPSSVVSPASGGADASPAAATETSTPVSKANSVADSESGTSTPKEKEKEKKKGGFSRFLGRGKKEKKGDGEDSGTSTPTGTPAPESATPSDTVASTLNRVEKEDDKYGQGKQFKEALQALSAEDLRRAFWDMVKCDNPDGLLLRFLRARKWDVEKALVMMVSTMHWRLKEMNVEELTRKGELAAAESKDEDYLVQIRMGKSYLHGVDKEGRPICYVRVRLHKAGEQSEESLERYTVYIMETARLMLKSPVDTAAVVFDMTDFGMANMDYAPVKYLIKCFEAHYPESLGVCLVHKAPWVFQGIWNIIKGWLDPVVASKIHFTRSMEDISQFIEKKNIPKELGGEEDWEYKFVEPVPGENDAQKDTAALEKLKAERKSIVEKYEELTRAWIQEPVVDSPAPAADKPPQTHMTDTLRARNELAKKLETGYWVMDKYVRARTVYDRLGYIKENGDIDFYAAGSTEEAPAKAEEKKVDVVVPEPVAPEKKGEEVGIAA